MGQCGTGGCGCATSEKVPGQNLGNMLTVMHGQAPPSDQTAAYEALAATLGPMPEDSAAVAALSTLDAAPSIARINGLALHEAGQRLDEEALRQRACTELLRQAAQQTGLLSSDDKPDTSGATSAAASTAIEQLLEQELRVPEPTQAVCRRYYETHPAAHRQGERVQLRHVLFAVTPGVDVRRLRERAEALLIELRCADDGGLRFAEAAAQWSNCPSGQQGGDLGWLTRADCAPEFAGEVFGSAEIGVLARLVHSRFGLHVVEVCAREAGQQPTFEEVHQAIAQTLRQHTWVNALRQYLQLLARAAAVEGVVLDVADSPLVQ